MTREEFMLLSILKNQCNVQNLNFGILYYKIQSLKFIEI